MKTEIEAIELINSDVFLRCCEMYFGGNIVKNKEPIGCDKLIDKII